MREVFQHILQVGPWARRCQPWPRYELLNKPNILLVTVLVVDLCTPLVVIHWCAASTTTATPFGNKTL